jgi:hypothetical protein
MTTTDDSPTAYAQAERAATGSPQDAIFEKLADRVGAHATVKAVYGDAIVRGGKTVIPIAKVRWGFGGGTGTGPTDAASPGASGSGTGAGGGVTAEPIGYLEIDETVTSFKPIVSPYPSPLFLLAAGLTATLIIRAFARLIRG